MNRFSVVAALALFSLLAPAVAGAQIPPPPTPSPDPHLYTDPGMAFTAPADAYLVGRRVIPLNSLGENLETVAAWIVNPGKENARVIQISMESFTGPPNQWEGQFESQMHTQGQGLLIRSKTAMTLTNGMPATFVEITSGSGFDAKKEYAVVFADGQRGIAIAEIARLGELDAHQARSALQNASVVRYPMDQP